MTDQQAIDVALAYAAALSRTLTPDQVVAEMRAIAERLRQGDDATLRQLLTELQQWRARHGGDA